MISYMNNNTTYDSKDSVARKLRKLMVVMKSYYHYDNI